MNTNRVRFAFSALPTFCGSAQRVAQDLGVTTLAGIFCIFASLAIAFSPRDAILQVLAVGTCANLIVLWIVGRGTAIEHDEAHGQRQEMREEFRTILVPTLSSSGCLALAVLFICLEGPASSDWARMSSSAIAREWAALSIFVLLWFISLAVLLGSFDLNTTPKRKQTFRSLTLSASLTLCFICFQTFRVDWQQLGKPITVQPLTYRFAEVLVLTTATLLWIWSMRGEQNKSAELHQPRTPLKRTETNSTS